jgi:cation diffusion facilitator CzcD-associated flavoprotein CzcO
MSNRLTIYRHVTVRNLKTNADFKDTADVVISARGGLNKIAWPKIEGLGDFEGKLMHSGAWDERCVPSFIFFLCFTLN